jgi:hypothetical protein
VKALPSLERLSTVASTRFRPCAAGLDDDEPPAMDGSDLPACEDEEGKGGGVLTWEINKATRRLEFWEWRGNEAIFLGFPPSSPADEDEDGGKKETPARLPTLPWRQRPFGSLSFFSSLS